MRIGQEINPALYDFVPPQFTFPKDEVNFLEYHKLHPHCIYIAKPVASAEGNSIVLFKEYFSFISSLINHSYLAFAKFPPNLGMRW